VAWWGAVFSRPRKRGQDKTPSSIDEFASAQELKTKPRGQNMKIDKSKIKKTAKKLALGAGIAAMVAMPIKSSDASTADTEKSKTVEMVNMTLSEYRWMLMLAMTGIIIGIIHSWGVKKHFMSYDILDYINIDDPENPIIIMSKLSDADKEELKKRLKQYEIIVHEDGHVDYIGAVPQKLLTKKLVKEKADMVNRIAKKTR
jgi:hypothetical protein